MDNSVETDVVVIGGGISGLASAFELQQRGLRVTLLEAAPRVGGVIASVRRDGVLYERGPNSSLDTTPLVNELLDALGIRGERADARPEAAIRYIVRNGALIALPMSPGAFLATPAFSVRAKLMLLRELFVAPTPPGVEESIADFVRRRLGAEFLDYAIDPFVSGIYAGDPERISVPAAFPRLLALEQRYGGLIRGQVMGARERRRNPETAKNAAKTFSFREGMQALTDGVAAKLSHVECGMRVARVLRTGDGGFRIEGERDGEPFVRHARSVVLSTPAYAAAEIVRELAPEASAALAGIDYAPVAVVAAAFPRTSVAHPCAGFGFLVPKKENRGILGSLFSTSMFDNRGPAGTVLLTTFVGGRRDPSVAALPDAAVAERVLGELAALVGAREPLWTEVVRWARAIPQYDLGHLGRVARVGEAERQVAGLRFCANYRGGVSVSDCIKNARALADDMVPRSGAAPR